MRFQTVMNPKLAKGYLERGLWTNETFFGILEERASAHPEREVLADAKGRITNRTVSTVLKDHGDAYVGECPLK